MRTTSSVEAYNRVLNKYFTHKGGFFLFAHDLRAEEFLKSEEMKDLIYSGGATENKRRAKYVVRVCVCVFKNIRLICFFFVLSDKR